MEIFLSIIFTLSAAIILFVIAIFAINHIYKCERYEGTISDHFDGKRFYNIGWTPGESMRIERFDGKKGGLLYWLLHRQKRSWEKVEITPIVPSETVIEGWKITNIGHATYLIQTAGKNIITDPVWRGRASPWTWLGPKRYQDPGVELEKLPKIDLILLSHNHYDHMEVSTLRYLVDRDGAMIYTGLGNKRYLEKRGIKNVVEMDWWESINRESKIEIQKNKFTDSFRITFLPAQHFSARGITDRNRTLWGAFCLEIGGRSLYFGGDTGYGTEFIEKTRERFSDGFDYGLLPIGAYKPRWFMAPVHTDPFEGMQMQRDLGITRAIGIHHSCFDLADDNQDDPVNDLLEAKKNPKYKDQIFEIGNAGTVWEW